LVFEVKDAPTVNVEISTLQGGETFLNINLFAEAFGNIGGSVFIGFITLNRLSTCTNF